MQKTLENFIIDNFESLDGTMDVFEKEELNSIVNSIEIWDYSGDKLLFSIDGYNDDTYSIKLWCDNNKDLLVDYDYISPTEEELVEAVQNILKKYNTNA